MTETASLFVVKAFVYGLMLASGFFLFNFFAKYAEFYGVEYMAGRFHKPISEDVPETPCQKWNKEWFCIRIPFLRIKEIKQESTANTKV